jgi:hypothetical protein
MKMFSLRRVTAVSRDGVRLEALVCSYILGSEMIGLENVKKSRG